MTAQRKSQYKTQKRSKKSQKKTYTPLGTMSTVTRNPGAKKLTTMTLHRMQKESPSSVLKQVGPGLGHLSPFGVYGYYENKALHWCLNDFLSHNSGLHTTWDQYRFKELEVFATVIDFDSSSVNDGSINNPCILMSSVDLDDAEECNWSGDSTCLCSRNNIGATVLRANAPYQRIAKFAPVGNFINSSSDNPANAVPTSKTWWDMAKPTQKFNGLKISAFADYAFTVYFIVKATIEFKGGI